jgi:hypothetical protein
MKWGRKPTPKTKKVALQITLESASRLLSRFFFIVEHHPSNQIEIKHSETKAK